MLFLWNVVLEIQNLVKNLIFNCSSKWWLTSKHLIEYTSECPKIWSVARQVLIKHLWRNIKRSSNKSILFTLWLINSSWIIEIKFFFLVFKYHFFILWKLSLNIRALNFLNFFFNFIFVNDFWVSKICNFNMPFWIKQNIFWFQISMNNFMSSHFLKSANNFSGIKFD